MHSNFLLGTGQVCTTALFVGGAKSMPPCFSGLLARFSKQRFFRTSRIRQVGLAERRQGSTQSRGMAGIVRTFPAFCETVSFSNGFVDWGNEHDPARQRELWQWFPHTVVGRVLYIS